MDLNELRQGIDALDEQLLAILNRRMEYVREVGKVKQQAGAVIYRPEREKQILDRLCGLNKGLMSRKSIEALYQQIFAISRNFELPEKVGFLGPQGSFTHQAAESKFGLESEYIDLPSILSVFENVDAERVRFGIVPIENNQKGFVTETLDYLYGKNVEIVAELSQPIHFVLGSTEDDTRKIKRIYSKDIAFGQCQSFLDEYFGNRASFVPANSTSKAALMALEDPEGAAICSAVAAKIHRLPILFQNIENTSDNRTRFIVLAKNFDGLPSGKDKTAIRLTIPDKPGSLGRVLQNFDELGINLCDIQSRPINATGGDFRHWFFIEFEGHRKDANIQKLFEKHGEAIKCLGSFVREV